MFEQKTMHPDALAECVGEVQRIGDLYPAGSSVDNVPTFGILQTVKACEAKGIPVFNDYYHILTAKTHKDLLAYLVHLGKIIP